MKEFNFIYEKLVEDEQDVVGLVAYGLYKKKKIAFIKSLKDKGTPESEIEQHIKIFNLSSLNHIDLYRLDAEKISSDFADDYVKEIFEEAAAELNDDYLQKDERLSKKHKLREMELIEKMDRKFDKLDQLEIDYARKIKFSFFKGVFQSLTASFIFAFCAGILIILLVGLRTGFDQIGEEALRLFKGANLQQIETLQRNQKDDPSQTN
jgi:hypothetical protein